MQDESTNSGKYVEDYRVSHHTDMLTTCALFQGGSIVMYVPCPAVKFSHSTPGTHTARNASLLALHSQESPVVSLGIRIFRGKTCK